MKYTIDTEIIINKPIDEVWSAFRNFKAHGQWNTFLRIHDEHLEVGRSFPVDFLSDGKVSMKMKPTLLSDQPNDSFEWIGHLMFKGLFYGHHQFLFKRIDDASTRFIQKENFSGFLVRFVKKSVLKPTEQNFNHINQTFKTYVESL